VIEWLVLLFLCVSFPLAYSAWNKQKRKQALDEQLPGALFSMALFESSVPLEDVFFRLSDHLPNPVSEVFAFLSGQLRAGIGFVPSVHAACRRFDSVLLPRVAGLWLAAYRGGADFSMVYKRVAEDALWFQKLSRERAQSFMVPQYTLYAGAVLVPLLLGWLYAFSGGQDASVLSDSVFWGLHVYLAAFGVFSGLLVALMRSSVGRAPVLALGLSVVSVLCFRFSAGVLI
jgi:hypothetical protein